MVILGIWLLVLGYAFIYLGTNKLSGGSAAFGPSFLGPSGLPSLIPKTAGYTPNSAGSGTAAFTGTARQQKQLS